MASTSSLKLTSSLRVSNPALNSHTPSHQTQRLLAFNLSNHSFPSFKFSSNTHHGSSTRKSNNSSTTAFFFQNRKDSAAETPKPSKYFFFNSESTLSPP